MIQKDYKSLVNDSYRLEKISEDRMSIAIFLKDANNSENVTKCF